MNMKAVSALFVLASFAAFSQPKVYMFDDVQRRNDKQQWDMYLTGDEDCVAYFSEDEIAMNIDRLYHLTIITTTHLPDNGVVYLCKDEKQRDVTVTLIGNERMFFYAENKRFLINFKPSGNPEPTVAAFANAED